MTKYTKVKRENKKISPKMNLSSDEQVLNESHKSETKSSYVPSTREWYENPHKEQSFLPLHMGTSGCNKEWKDVMTGTLGCIVKRKIENDYKYFILSAGHIFGDVFKSSHFPSEDKIIHPSTNDTTCKETKIVGKVTCWKELIPNRIYKKNKIDAGLAEVYRYNKDSEKLISGEILGLGSIYDYYKNPNIHLLKKNVIKSGRTTRVTEGTVIGVGHVIVWYSDTKYVLLLNQLIIEGNEGHFSLTGDAGSVVITKDNKNRNIVCGLVYAGNKNITIASPVKHIVQDFGIEFNIDELTKYKHEPKHKLINDSPIYNTDNTVYIQIKDFIDSNIENIFKDNNITCISTGYNSNNQPCMIVYGKELPENIANNVNFNVEFKEPIKIYAF